MSSPRKRMYIKRRGLLEKEVDGSIVVYDDREGEVLRFNETAGFIWRAIGPSRDLEDIERLVARNFGIDEHFARRDVLSFTGHLRDMELVQEVRFDLAKRVGEVYGRVPGVACEHCAACCTNVVIYSIEFEGIRDHVERWFSEELKEELRAKFALNVATQVRERQILEEKGLGQMRPFEVCAFLDADQKRCLIYPLRPFACRVYGLEAGDCRTKSSRPPGAADVRSLRGLREELEAVSSYYVMSGESGVFNKAEMSRWFYHAGTLTPAKKTGVVRAKG